MKLINRIITSIALSAALVSTPLLASDINEERARLATETMEEELNLSDAQAEKVYALNKQLFSDLSGLRDQGSSNRMAQVRALRALGKERDSAMQEILNDEQYEDWKANASERREEMRAMMRERRQ